MKNTRRNFIKKASGAMVSVLAAPTIIPASALGRNGFVAPSDRINLAVIGAGNQGGNDTRAFLKDPAPEKRGKLVDDLLSRPECKSPPFVMSTKKAMATGMEKLPEESLSWKWWTRLMQKNLEQGTGEQLVMKISGKYCNGRISMQ